MLRNQKPQEITEVLDPSQSRACGESAGPGITIFLIVSFEGDAELITSIPCGRWSMSFPSIHPRALLPLIGHSGGM
jgi:hypothetical protein